MRWSALRNLTLLSASLLLGVWFWEGSKQDRSESPSRMAYGGKPGLHFKIQSAIDPNLSADRWTEAEILFETQEQCSQLSVSFRGMDGLEVENPGQPQELGACTPGTAQTLTVRVRAATDIAGYLAADVRMDGRGGTTSLPFRAGQAKFRLKSAGKAKVTPSGEAIQELNPTSAQ